MTEKMMDSTQPIQGVGIGLRAPHVKTILAERPAVAWFEVLSDNYLQHQGWAFEQLLALRAHYPMVLHGVGLSLGSTDPLNPTYLRWLRTLAQQIKPTWISEHLAWVSAQQQYFPQLLPLPYTPATLVHVAARINSVQDYLGAPILIENVSSYLEFTDSTMPEWEFLNIVVQHTGCSLLLDINNIYINSCNAGFAAENYLQQIEPTSIKQFHLAGYQEQPNYLLDSHDAPVSDPVWKLYELALKRFGAVPTLIEWDEKIPEFSVLLAEAQKAESYLNKM